jgi:energy-coupling factor transporter ATP-binding protein EcfA2
MQFKFFSRIENRLMALQVPNGSRWYKFEFHCHTPASSDYGKGPRQDFLLKKTPREWLLDYMRADFDCVAVTDHNTGAWIDKLKEALALLQSENPHDPNYRDLLIFPGVEVTANGGQQGIHILAIFSPSNSTMDVERFLGGLQFQGNGSKNAEMIAGVSALDVCKKAVNAGGIAIPAHVEASCGLFSVLANGLEQQTFLKAEPVFAIEVLNRSIPKPQEYLKRNLNWSEIAGSDAHHPRGEAGQNYPGSRFTWVKMGELPSLEGLRLALHDGMPLSIQRSDQSTSSFNRFALVVNDAVSNVTPNAWAELTIEQLTVKEAQFCGHSKNEDCSHPLELKLSPWLNCIVGGRGTGKSTLVELVRLVLQRKDELTGEPENNFQRFAQTYNKASKIGALTAATRIELIYRRRDSRYKITWRMNSQADLTTEEDKDGEWITVDGEIANRFPIRIYSQKQVFELSRDTFGLLKIIDDSAEVGRRDWESSWQQEEAKFLQLRAQIRQCQIFLQEESRLKGSLDDVIKKLAVFEQTDHANLLKRYQVSQRQKQWLENLFTSYSKIENCIHKVLEDIETPKLDTVLFNDEAIGDDIIEVMATFASSVEEIKQDIFNIEKRMGSLVRKSEKAAWETKWGRAVADCQTKYEDVKHQLAAIGSNDPNEYSNLVKRRQAIENEISRICTIRKQMEGLSNEAKIAYQNLQSIRQELTRKRTIFLEKVLAGNEFVKISILPYGDYELAETEFRRIIGKDGTTYSRDILGVDNDRREGLLADLFREYFDGSIASQFDIETRLETMKKSLAQVKGSRALEGARDQRFVNHIADLNPEAIDRLLIWWPSDSLKVEYNSGTPKGEWRSILQGSPGQKTAAMLAFLLSYGTEPIILDQPEDDLDNHLIYDLVVQQVRDNKQHRQIIIVTHNPNIVVNGDAELIVIMDYRAGQCVVEKSGCMQERTVRDGICTVMEGGREAFEKRYRRVILENT